MQINRSTLTHKQSMTTTMASGNQLHFIMVPLMCPGHLIPMVDMAHLLAGRGVIITMVTTPANADRVRATVLRAADAGLQIRLHELDFPGRDFGLPDGCENVDALPSLGLVTSFFLATKTLQGPVTRLIEEVKPHPTCIICDRNLQWTEDVARESGIPRILFDGTSCFTQLSNHNLKVSKTCENLSESATVVVPGLPDKVEFRKSQLPGIFNPGKDLDRTKLRHEIDNSAGSAYGIIINTFEELEGEYIKAFKEVKGEKVWCVGPLSLCNKDKTDMAERGNNNIMAQDESVRSLMSWLDSQAEKSVIYACMGSLNRIPPQQLKELGLGLEASKRSFVWVIRGANKGEEFEEWLREDGLEERVRGRGFLIRGWAPQVLILSHRAVGGFLTHCGWNSCLEAISVGLPMVTWPLFAEQFYNEKVIVEILKAGVAVGAPSVMKPDQEEEHGVMVRREDVRKAVEAVMDEEKGAEMRERAERLGKLASKALETSGSSYINLTRFIDDIARTRKNQSMENDAAMVSL